MKRASLFVLLLAGCASSSGVVPTGPDTYMISAKDTAIGASGHDAAALSYREAAAFCAKDGKDFAQIKVESRGPGFARFPSSRLDFRCVDKAERK